MIYATILLLLTLFSRIPLFFFSPLIVWFSYRRPLLTTLWIALCCGLVIDLLSPYKFFALHTLTYSLATPLLYRFRLRFFFPSVALYSLTLTLLQATLIHPTLSWNWLFVDLIFLPLVDATFGLILFKVNLHALRWAYGRAYRWQKRRRRHSRTAKRRN